MLIWGCSFQIRQCSMRATKMKKKPMKETIFNDAFGQSKTYTFHMVLDIYFSMNSACYLTSISQ